VTLFSVNALREVRRETTPAQGRHVIATRLIGYENSVMCITIQHIRWDSSVKILSHSWNYQIHTAEIKVSTKFGRAVAQEVSRWLPTAAARVRAQVRTCGICGGQSGAGAGFLRVLRFPLPILILPTAPHSSSIIRCWYNRPVSRWRIKYTQSHPIKEIKKLQNFQL
jgi:hypothetical protein